MGCKIVAERSVQLPTGSARMNSGAPFTANRPAADRNSEKRQQKHPPVISCVAKPAASAMRVSTSSPPWSFRMMPTCFPAARSRCPAASRNVVFPAPRNPPTRIRCGDKISEKDTTQRHPVRNRQRVSRVVNLEGFVGDKQNGHIAFRARPVFHNHAFREPHKVAGAIAAVV